MLKSRYIYEEVKFISNMMIHLITKILKKLISSKNVYIYLTDYNKYATSFRFLHITRILN